MVFFLHDILLWFLDAAKKQLSQQRLLSSVWVKLCALQAKLRTIYHAQTTFKHGKAVVQTLLIDLEFTHLSE